MAKVNIERLPGESDGDFRRRYHRVWEDQDRRARGIEPKKKHEGPCSRDGCENPAEIKGMCGKHYRTERSRQRRAAGIHETDKHSHPLYSTWMERKHRKGLCEAWLDFDVFTEAVGERPTPNHFLARRVYHDPYGPENWEWKEHIRREPGESDKSFNARKWQAQKKRRPDMDVRRGLIRDFGIDEAQYQKMHADQGGMCAICGCPETSIDGRRGKPRNLSVDHCHITLYARDLLCQPCNTAIGMAKESPEIMRSMIAYVEKWKDAVATSKALGRPPRLEAKGHHITILDTEWGPLPLQEAAKRVGLKPGTVDSRIQKGWPMDKVLLPLRRPSYRNKPTALPFEPEVGNSPPYNPEEDEVL